MRGDVEQRTTSVVQLDHYWKSSLPCKTTGKLPYKKKSHRVILLQGPVGPFFSCLHDYLEKTGFDTWRITLNAGDKFYARSKNNIGFNGGEQEWRLWFRNFLTVSEADCIILFGAERTAHKIARYCAKKQGIPVISLEEGYVRPGFVTVETDGNNGSSPLAGMLPSVSFHLDNKKNSPSSYSSFLKMCRYGAIYYTIRTLFSSFSQRQLFHRRVNLLTESFGWSRNAIRLLRNTFTSFDKIQNLLEFWEKKYFLVPLQVSTDTQLADAAMGWTNARLIMETLKSFSQSAPECYHIVFKIHPMERGHSNNHKLIRQTARLLGMEHRVHVLDNGSLGLLTRYSAGMITINSTSGLSAIFHGIPLLVIGRALYANPGLAVCAFGKPDFDAFWTDGYVADKQLRHRYLDWVKDRCLKVGDFYNRDGMEMACQGILDVINTVTTAPVRGDSGSKLMSAS